MHLVLSGHNSLLAGREDQLSQGRQCIKRKTDIFKKCNIVTSVQILVCGILAEGRGEKKGMNRRGRHEAKIEDGARVRKGLRKYKIIIITTATAATTITLIINNLGLSKRSPIKYYFV